MTAGVAVWAALLGLLVLACVGALVSEEVRGRLERLPHALIALAARRAPPEMRAELREEWAAELHEILRGAEALRITRLVSGIRYAAGLLRTARGIGRQLSPNHDRYSTDTRRNSIIHGAAIGITFNIATYIHECFGTIVGVTFFTIFNTIFHIIFSVANRRQGRDKEDHQDTSL
jgi:hypothetical protein